MKEILQAYKNLITTNYKNKEDLEKDLIILKEIILIEKNQYFVDRQKVLTLFH